MFCQKHLFCIPVQDCLYLFGPPAHPRDRAPLPTHPPAGPCLL